MRTGGRGRVETPEKKCAHILWMAHWLNTINRIVRLDDPLPCYHQWGSTAGWPLTLNPSIG